MTQRWPAAWRPPPPVPHPEFQEEFRGDARLAPGRVALGHRSDQALEVRRKARAPGPRPPAPNESECFPVPADQGCRFDNRQRFAPGETPGQQEQRKADRIRRPAGPHLPFPVQGQLLPEEEVLGREGGPGLKAGPHEPHEIDPERGTHAAQVNERFGSSHDGSGSSVSSWNSPQYMRSNARRGSLSVWNEPQMEFLRTTGMKSMGCFAESKKMSNRE